MSTSSERTVVFVCLHGSAKSVIASGYMNRFADERGLDIRAVASGVDPEPNIPPHVKRGLLQDGLDVSGQRPQRVTRKQLAAAWHVVSFGCDLTDLAPSGLAVERWDDVPLVSDGFQAARDAILARVRRLLDDVAGERGARE